MPHITQFDHIGVTVRDLDRATEFFVSLGCEIEGRTVVEGDFIDTVIGIPDSKSEIVMLQPPGGSTKVELSSFVRPEREQVTSAAAATELGLRSLAFQVDDLAAFVERLSADGYSLVGGIGQYENVWKMAYVRGPENIIVALAERIG